MLSEIVFIEQTSQVLSRTRESRSDSSNWYVQRSRNFGVTQVGEIAERDDLLHLHI